MLSLQLVLSAIVLLGFSGLPGCLLSPQSALGQRLATALMLIGSLLGICGLALSFDMPAPSLHIPWFLPWGQFAVTLDPLSAVFLGLVFVVPGLGSIYGLGYWKQSEHADNGRQLALFYGVLAGSMGLVVIARDGILFLIAWEIMAMAAYFVATAEEDNPEVRRAGWVYLIATHVGTLFLFAMFSLWYHATGSFALELTRALPDKTAGTIFVLALIGFGFKAGLMPLHVWLPGAHANAPSHVSAVMSGVMLKLGIYGILRVTALFPANPVWWGGVLLTVGSITGVAGIAFAIGQYDLKRMLAYSSIENIGIIAIGLGLTLLGRALGRWDWILLGLGGSLLHVWNHGLFKSLLFFNAGAIIHDTHTRDLDHLGGLAKKMPRTAVFFLVGAVAICALPPLNGFVSEWLLYLGLFHTLNFNTEPGIAAAATAAVALAMIGALAVACFVKLFGAVFLGTPRTSSTEHAHDPEAAMLVPVILLALGCTCIGVFPMLAMPMLENAVRTWALPLNAPGSLANVLPWHWITWLGFALVVLAAGIFGIIKVLPRIKRVPKKITWDCGYAQPTARMQYTGSSFGQTIVQLFSFMLHPQTYRPAMRSLFPKPTPAKTFVPDLVLDRWVLPLFNFAGRTLPGVRVLQQGQTYLYLLYILIITIILPFFWGVGIPS
jgi:hydrogenase-4 component B